MLVTTPTADCGWSKPCHNRHGLSAAVRFLIYPRQLPGTRTPPKRITAVILYSVPCCQIILRSRIYLFLIRLPFRHLLHMARYHTFPKNKKRTNQILCFRGMICTSPTVSSRFILRDYFPDTSGEQDKLRMTARSYLLSTASIIGISPFPIISLVF